MPAAADELIGQARAGDQRAWELIVRQHRQPVFRLAYLLLGDPDDAEDVAQDAFIRAYRHLDRFDPARPLRPWLMRITSNLAHNRIRSVKRYWRALERAARRTPSTQIPFERDDAQVLWQAIRRLRRADQQVIYLRYFLEVSESEMADVLEIRPGTVKSRLHRALARLRAVIDSEYSDLRSRPI